MKAFLKTTKGKIILGAAALLIILLAVLLITKVVGGEDGYRSISVSEISGSVMTETDGKKYEAYKNMRLADGYALTTDADSYTRMVLDSDKYVKLEEKSRALFEALGSDKQRKTAIRLEDGTLTTEITAPLGEDEDYIVNTPNAVLAVRGTFFKAAVRYDTNGDAYTDVYTYGGTVMCKRVMPDGTLVDEEVMITSGYKARVKMDEIITVYVEELIEEDEDNVDPIDIKEVPDGDIVDIYNAAANGHKMFADIPELWQEITERGIDLNDYHSVYDGGEIPPYNGDGVTTTEKQPEAVTEAIPEAETNAPETLGEVTDIPEEYDYNYDGTDVSYPAETTAAETNTDSRTESHTYTEVTEHTHTPQTEIFEDEPAVTEVTSVTVTETTSAETASTETEPTVYTEASLVTTVSSEIKPPVYTDDSNTTASQTERPESSVTTVPDVTSVPDSTSNTGGTSQTNNTSQTGSGSTETVPTEPDVHVHKFEEYIPDGNATCTEDGTKTAVCSCGEKDTVIDAGSAGHKEIREVTEATAVFEGRIYIYCRVCDEVIANEIIPKLPIYIDDGSLVISETGFSQGGGEEVPYTGDYNISQKSGGTANSSITVLSGTHNIAFNGIDISASSDVFTVEKAAAVTISGGNRENKLAATGANGCGLYSSGGSVTVKSGIFSFSGSYGMFGTADSTVILNGGYIFMRGEADGIRSSGTLGINGGTVSAEGGDNGIWSNGGLVITGGNISARGENKNDIKTYTDAKVSGGSIRAVGGKIDGAFVNNFGDELECEAFDVFPSETVRTFENSDGSKYIYSLAPEDKASDGFYYVWKPIDFTPPFDGTVYMDDGSVTITADGITQGGKTIPWTEDIVISQKDRSTAFDANITVESGMHNITLDGVNINSADGNGLNISVGASVSLDSSYKENIIASAKNNGINNSGTLRINGGAFSVSGGNCGLYNASAADVNGGRMSLSGGVCDIFNEGSGTLTVSGGSMKPENSAVGGVITNANGDVLECKEYSEYTGDLTFEDGGGNEYTYALAVSDSIGGSYYVWQPIAAAPEGVEVSVENFPDTVFRNYVLDNFDTDSDGYLSDSEIKAVTEVNVGGTYEADGGVTSLKGIEYFENLVTLNCHYNSTLKSLDVSHNTKLSDLACFYTQITSLDVSNNTALWGLSCGNTDITSLDISNNARLRGLYCDNVNITSLDVSNNTALEVLYCEKTNITSLDVSKNMALIDLRCNDTRITSLDISNNTALTCLLCDNTDITNLNVNNTALKTLNCYNTQITSLDVSKNIDLRYLDCNDTQITSLDVSKNTALERLYCDNTKITSLDLSNNTALTELDCHKTNISHLDFTKTAIDTFNAIDCKHYVTVVDGKFDTKTIDGFDLNKVSELKGASKGENGVIGGIKEGTVVTYWYDCGRGFSEEFTLVPDDKSTFATEDEPFNGTLDLSAGAVTITAEGFVQNGVTTPWTGDYIISGDNGSSPITIESGRHNITLDGADISAGGYGLTVSAGAEVTLSGSGTVSGISVSGTLNTDNCEIVSEGQYGVYISGSGKVSIASGSLDLSGSNIGIFCSGTLEISGGSVSAEGGNYGIMNDSNGVVSITGGRTEISGGMGDIYSSGKLTVTGGSVRAVNDTVIGSITGADGAELECAVYDTFPSEAERTFENSDGSAYVYPLNEGDRAADGKYYVWKPKAAPAPTGVEVSEENFPDSVFREYVSDNFDTDSNGWLSDSEIEAVTKVNVSVKKIYSLHGIEHFKALKMLYCYNTPLTSLDVSNNTALIDLSCYNTQIPSLDVSKNTALEYLECATTQITSLDVSKNTALKTLYCYNTQITSLDVSKNTNLTYFQCSNTQITSLDVSKNTALDLLRCDNTKIPYVDITNSPRIKYFSASGCEHPITVTNGKFDTKTIDGFDYTRVSGCDIMDANGVLSGITEGTNITYTYDCGQGKSETFTLVPDEYSTFDTEIPEGVAVNEENFPDTVFREYVSTNFDKDSDGYLSDEEIAAVTMIDVSYEEIYSLQGIENFTALTYLYCDNTQITSLDVSNNMDLAYLRCFNTQITSLDVRKNTALRWLRCDSTQIPYIDITNNSIISYFNATGCTYEILSTLSFDITTDPNFIGFNPYNVSNVQGADFYPESGIFDNFTSNTITYDYDCGNGRSATFTLVMTGEPMFYGLDDEDIFEDDFPEQDIPEDDITTDIPEQTDGDDIPPENTEQDNGGEDISADTPEQEIIGEDIPPADEPEQSIPDILLDAVVTTAASAAANITDITIFSANIVIYLISILIKLWR